jgi:hypothetical protein
VLGEVAVRNRVLPAGIPTRSRAPLEIIRFAAANHLCVDLNYDGSVRRIEPYSLRRTQEGNYVLHAVRSDSSEHRSYRVDRMQGASVTDQSFVPRYVIELTGVGPLSVAPTVAQPRVSIRAPRSPWTPPKPRRAPRARATPHAGPVYVFRCTVCNKQFRKKSWDASLNPHKHPRGYECPGRVGVMSVRSTERNAKRPT